MERLSDKFLYDELLKFNPLMDSVDAKVEEYNAAFRGEKEFTGWVEKEEIGVKDFSIDLKYGLPINIIGNPESASIFCCLMNPSINDSHYKNDYSLKDYTAFVEDDDAFAEDKGTLEKDLLFIKNNENPVSYLDYYGRYYKLVEDILNGSDKLENTDKICNIDLIPFRSKDPKVFSQKKIVNPYSKFSVLVMLWKISSTENDKNKPFFFLRSAANYCKVIDQVLADLKQHDIYVGNNISSFEDLLVKENNFKDGYILGLGGDSANSTRKPYLLNKDGSRNKKVEDVPEGLNLLKERTASLLK